jgi:hypothetical protein
VHDEMHLTNSDPATPSPRILIRPHSSHPPRPPGCGRIRMCLAALRYVRLASLLSCSTHLACCVLPTLVASANGVLDFADSSFVARMYISSTKTPCGFNCMSRLALPARDMR